MNTLRDRLMAAMEPRQIFNAPVWGNPRVMTEALRDIKRTFGGSDDLAPAKDVLQAALRNFAMTQQIGSFTELKHICYGLTVPVGDNEWRLIDREPLFTKLLNLVETRSGQAKQYRRCYQGLLNAYFGFDRHAGRINAGTSNWIQLRGYLGARLRPLLKATADRGTMPEWLHALAAHRNLLTDDPCSRFAGDLRAGRTDELRAVCLALGIPSTSWVWGEALIAYVQLVCELQDAAFGKALPAAMDLVNGRTEFSFAEMLAKRAAAVLAVRYSNCGDPSEHTDLRDTTVRLFGNPWIDRTSWDANVHHEPARQMIEGWLKRRLIKDFFELLAHDGGADLARLNYWLKWEPRITDMWFVLGASARQNRSEAFLELRKRMVGRERALVDPNSQNNAFVMKIGQLLVIEFGVLGNACYVFAASEFKTDLEQKTHRVFSLKQRTGATRLSHMSRWESRFDSELGMLLNSVPMSKGTLATKNSSSRADVAMRPMPSSQPPAAAPVHVTTRSPASSQTVSRLLELARAQPQIVTTSRKRKALSEADLLFIRQRCVKFELEIKDNRSKGGALWILTSDRNNHGGFSTLLELQGFQYSPGRGYWFEDEG